MLRAVSQPQAEEQSERDDQLFLVLREPAPQGVQPGIRDRGRPDDVHLHDGKAEWGQQTVAGQCQPAGEGGEVRVDGGRGADQCPGLQ
jgi:hypothetical protein